MEGLREKEVGSRIGGSMHPNVATMDTHLRLIRDYALPPLVTPLLIRRLTIQENNFELKSITL